MAIVEKYEQFIAYFYPVLQNVAKKYRNLIGTICDPANLRAAYHRAARGKRMTHAYLEFKEFAEVNLARYSHSHLGLTFSKWSVAPVSRGVNFLGYRIWPNHKLLRRQSVVRAKRVIAALRERGATERLNAFLAAWIGHAKWADAHNLLRSLNLENDHVADQHPRRP